MTRGEAVTPQSLENVSNNDIKQVKKKKGFSIHPDVVPVEVQTRQIQIKLAPAKQPKPEAEIKKPEIKKPEILLSEAAHKALTHHEIERLVHFDESEPFRILGPHQLSGKSGVVVRAFLPHARLAWVHMKTGTFNKRPMLRLHEKGFFQAIFECETEIFPYVLCYEDYQGRYFEVQDPYAFQKSDLTNFDLYLLTEGTHYKSYEKLGARLITLKGVQGVAFSVWAPNAKSVSVIGNFNGWQKGVHPMMKLNHSFWYLFIPGLKEGEVYKYAIKSWNYDQILEKSDPYGFFSELRPCTGSVVKSLGNHVWKDKTWLETRAKTNPLERPVAIYEVHLGSWKRKGPDGSEFLNYRELAHDIVTYAKEMGYTHLELMPIMEHPLDESWGYQVVSYYAPTSRFGNPEDFMYFVDHCHQNGIGVILDWVPAHFPKDGHGLANFDGRQIYAYESWKKAEHRDWGTLVFDYGRNEVRNFLISNALFWLDKYHVDGLRIDAVASMLYLDYSRHHSEWEPNVFGGNTNLEAVDFIKRMNEVCHLYHPGVMTIAEESTAWGGVSRPTYANGLGFSMKWNMGWMHDTLEYFSKEPIHRRYHQGMLTFSMLYAFTENFVLPISHDEVVFGKRSLLDKMPGDDWQRFANLRLFLTYMYAHPGKKLLFMGQDIGQWAEWNCKTSLDWHLMQYDRHQKINRCLRDLNKIYKGYRAFYEMDFDWQGFEWIDFCDADSSVLSSMRWSKDRKQGLLCTFNMTPVPRMHYRLGVPKEGFYTEIFNSDAAIYGGGGVGNYGGVGTDRISSHGREFSVNVNLPPLGGNIYFWGLK